MKSKLVRLNKFIAEHGITSRRKADDLILAGDVKVNGQIVWEVGTKVDSTSDSVKVKGKLLRAQDDFVYVMLNKPTGYLTTLFDPEGRPTVKDLVKDIPQRVFPVGRLDYESEGLILLTNDGDFAQKVIHPEHKLKKEYFIKIKGKPDSKQIERLMTGVTLAEGRRKALVFDKIRTGGQHDWYKIVITEGKHRQVRRMMEKVGLDVLKIKRTAVGRLKLGDVERGDYKFLKKHIAELAIKE